MKYKFEKITLVVILIFISFIYLMFPARIYTDDDLRYALAIEKGNFTSLWFSHPYHIAFSWVGYSWYKIWLFYGYTGGAILPIQIFNTALGVLGIFLFFRLLIFLKIGILAAACASLFLAFSFGYWNSSISLGIYAFETAVLILLFLRLVVFLKSPSLKNVLLLGLCCGIANLLHTLNIFLFPIILLLTFLITKKLKFKIFYSLIFLVVSLFVIGSVYLLVINFCLKFQTISEIQEWLFKYKGCFSGLEPKSLVRIIYAQTRAIWGGFFLKNIFLGHYACRDLVLSGLLSLNIILIPPLIILLIKKVREICANYKEVALLSICIFIAYYTFFIFYEQDYKFFIRLLLPVAIVYGLLADGLFKSFKSNILKTTPPLRTKIYQATVIFLLPVTMFSVNFFGSVLPQSDIKNNEELNYANFVVGHTKPNSLVIFFCRGSSTAVFQVEYFYRDRETAHCFYLSQRAAKELERKIEGAIGSGRDVYLVSAEKNISAYTFYNRAQKPVSQEVEDFVLKFGYKVEEIFIYDGRNYEHNFMYKIRKK